MNLTKEEIDGLDANVMDYDIPDAATETILRLIAYWKSQEDTPCRNCGNLKKEHSKLQSFCYPDARSQRFQP